MSERETLPALLACVRACRICVDSPRGRPLPHEPRPVLVAHASATLAVCGQAPGTRVHASGVPFSDPSGERLRGWMGIAAGEFYDARRVAILPMGFCFPGLDAKGGDRPPRQECAPAWRDKVLAHLPNLRLMLLVGAYAQAWHLADARRTLTETVADWRAILARPGAPRLIPLPHPSWRNTGWLRRHPWFESELVPMLRAEVHASLEAAVDP